MGLKLFVRLMLLVLVLAIAGPVFLKGPDGRPMMTMDDVRVTLARTSNSMKMQWRRLRGDVGQALGDENAGKVEMYRWQDASGQWHYGDEVPEGITSETIYVDPDASRMDPIEIRPRERETAGPALDGSVVNPLRAREILDEVTNARDQANERQQELTRKLDDIR
ncbi:MAG: DUF4124 domain-containing protein [Pseudomonadota bacterium]